MLFPLTEGDMRVALLVLVAVTLAGCMDSVAMRNPNTGEMTKCGPYFGNAYANAAREAQCVRDYKEQGFVRAAN
jgi:hypothetical protein